MTEIQPSYTGSTRPEIKTGLCLNMIVKNEALVIERLLRSVREVVDYFVIVDTGSRDGTPELILKIAREVDLPGQIHHRVWRNFGANRQEALEIVTSMDYFTWALFLDADEELAYRDSDFYRHLCPGTSYLIEHHTNQVRYWAPKLVDIRTSEWRWEGVIHETIRQIHGPNNLEKTNEAWIIYHAGEGGRSRGITRREKYLRDAVILEKELERDPDNSRYRYYLAQSYRDAGELRKAWVNYDRRVRLNGPAEEAYVAQYEKARLSILLGLSPEIVTEEGVKAYNMRPSRAEPLWLLANYYRTLGLYHECWGCATKGLKIPYPDDTMSVLNAVYDWMLYLEFALSCSALGKHMEALVAFDRVLQQERIPPEFLINIKNSYQHALSAGDIRKRLSPLFLPALDG